MKLQICMEKQGVGPLLGCNTQPVFTAYEFQLRYKGLERNALSERRCGEEFCLKSAVDEFGSPFFYRI